MFGQKRIPSREGGVEIVVEELSTRMAMAGHDVTCYGNCCLTSDIKECTEVIGNKAVVFKKSDVKDLQDKLQKLCDDSKLIDNYKDQAADYICNY